MDRTDISTSWNLVEPTDPLFVTVKNLKGTSTNSVETIFILGNILWYTQDVNTKEKLMADIDNPVHIHEILNVNDNIC